VRAEFVLALLLLLLSDHIVIGLRVGADFTVRVKGQLVSIVKADEIGIAEFTEDVCKDELCTAALTITGDTELEIGPVLCGVEAVTEQACDQPWNEAWGFYHSADDSMVGYVEFRTTEEGGTRYWYVEDGASFGWRTEEIYRRRLCNIEDWAQARTILGAPVRLCLRTRTGQVRCGP